MQTGQHIVEKPLPRIPPGLKRHKRLGKYRLDKRIGKGGYCEVWKARDSVEGTWVALKIPLLDNGYRDSQALLKEVRLVSQLRHPHIMPVKNADIIEGYAVLATELSVGTLDDCSRPMSVAKIINIIAQVLEGLAYAHSKKLVHCDVTPANIFLFHNGRAALGDFGIGFQLKGRPKTIDEFGTPGYVAPEQAYGRPTYRSDCFATALVLYEFLTGVLPRWPFYWPFKGHNRLQQRTSTEFLKFMRKALAIDPAKRFPSAVRMLAAMRQALPKRVRTSLAIKPAGLPQTNWRRIRRETFIRRYKKLLPITTACIDCGEPVAESMQLCPWCGSERNSFDKTTRLTHTCPRCRRGVLAEWRFCPWCYGACFDSPASRTTKGFRYHDHCKYCRGKLMRFMRYCPWCRRKVRKPWQAWPFPELCTSCGWSVDTNFWNYCPWCKQKLLH